MWITDEQGTLIRWIPAGRGIPQGMVPLEQYYPFVSSGQQAPAAPVGKQAGQQYDLPGGINTYLATQQFQAPQAPQAPQAMAPQAAQVQAAPSAPAPVAPAAQAWPTDINAQLEALRALRGQTGIAGDEATQTDALLGKIGQMIANGADPQAISAAIQATKSGLDAFSGGYANNVLSGKWNTDQRSEQFLQDINKALNNATVPAEKAQEQHNILTQAEKQANDRETLRQKLLGQIPALRNQLGEDLLNQETYAFNKMRPQIDQRLNALGLLQSGALPEAYARVQGDLENARQARLSDFSTNATNNLSLDLPLASLYQTQGQEEQALQSGIDLDRAAIQRRYQEQDLATQYQRQQDLTMRALDEARAARDQQSKTALWAAAIGGGSSLFSNYMRGRGGS